MGLSFEDDLFAQSIGKVMRTRARRIAIIGLTPAALGVRARLEVAQLGGSLLGIFDPTESHDGVITRPWAELRDCKPDLLIVAADRAKERLLADAHEALDGGSMPEVVIAGTGHMNFSDRTYQELAAPALVTSYAHGYANTRTHLYQCLQMAAHHGLTGAVVEFGAYKGGTTAWLARVVERLQLKSQVIAFDTWQGFPRRQSLFDLYESSRLLFDDFDAVQGHLAPLGVELVRGDISETVSRLEGVPILLAFVDTNNYTPARAALEVVVPNLVMGGSVVFDHYETTNEHIYAIGERLAAKDVLTGQGFLHLHGTGVFTKVFEPSGPYGHGSNPMRSV